MENGWFQWSELDLPSSLSIQSGINEPRYSTLKGIMSVKNKTIETCNSDEIYSDLNNGYVQKELLLPKKSKETYKIEGSTDEIVTNVIIGYYFFDDLPDKWILIGLIVIISSGVYISFREQEKKNIVVKSISH